MKAAPRRLARVLMSDAPTTWKLINMKVPRDRLRRIDAEAHRRGLTRTAYMVACSDPQSEKGEGDAEA